MELPDYVILMVVFLIIGVLGFWLQVRSQNQRK